METELLAQVSKFVEPFGCIATGFGPKSVGVKGDARVYGASVFIRFPEGTGHARIAEVSNKVTNEIPEITRVLMEIA